MSAGVMPYRSESAKPTVVFEVLIAAVSTYGMVTTLDGDPNRATAPAQITAEAVIATQILIMGRLSRPLFVCCTVSPFRVPFLPGPAPGLIDTPNGFLASTCTFEAIPAS
jgi:hypothetical protein